MHTEAENNHREWIRKAEEDELSASVLLKEQGSASTVCFLAQQMVEKYLKGLLVFHGERFPKAHDLTELEALVLRVEAGIEHYEDELSLLNRYYIETRYPGDYPDFTVEDAREALAAAYKVKEFVLKKLGS